MIPCIFIIMSAKLWPTKTSEDWQYWRYWGEHTGAVCPEITHEESKEYYDLKTKDPQYKVGQYVWLFDPTTPVGFSAKPKPSYLGPYVICEANKNHTYRLRNYKTGIDNSINAQRIKPAYLPWTSRISTTDPDRQRHIHDLRRGQIAAHKQKPNTTTTAKLQLRQQGNNKNTPQGQIKEMVRALARLMFLIMTKR